MINYYEILEIKENASQEVIKAAYRALAKKYHPDSYKGNEYDREKNMQLVNEAYEILSDEYKRTEYDKKIKDKDINGNNSSNMNSNYHSNNSYNTDNDFAYQGTCDNLNDLDKSFDEECKNEDSKHGWFGNFIRGVGKEISQTIQKNSQEMENAYLEGMSMDEYSLIRKFKNSKGYKRIGYTKALEEMGLLERNYDGKLVPTYRFKQFF